MSSEGLSRPVIGQFYILAPTLLEATYRLTLGRDSVRTSPLGTYGVRTSPLGTDGVRTSPLGTDGVRTSPLGTDGTYRLFFLLC
jgi:hypothetical protein